MGYIIIIKSFLIMTIRPYCKNTCYILQPNNHMDYIENNAIAGIPTPGPYSLSIYFSNAHLSFHVIN